MFLGSSAPVGTFVHAPSVPMSPHDLHAALQVVAQQKPCAQMPVPHSVGAEHGAPGGLGPQVFPTQLLGATQFADVVQALKHFVPLQAKGRHAREVGGVHWPVALQVGGPV